MLYIIFNVMNEPCHYRIDLLFLICRISGTSDPYVKFKIDGKQIYKSKTVHKNLNPRWNETFSHPLRDRDSLIEVRVGLLCLNISALSWSNSLFLFTCLSIEFGHVYILHVKFVMTLQVYDKNLTSDEFMGSSTISLRNLELQKWVLNIYFC